MMKSLAPAFQRVMTNMKPGSNKGPSMPRVTTGQQNALSKGSEKAKKFGLKLKAGM